MPIHPDERLALERLRRLIEERSGSVSALEQEMGKAAGYVSDLFRSEEGVNKPKQLRVRQLCEILDVYGLRLHDFLALETVEGDPPDDSDEGDEEIFPGISKAAFREAFGEALDRVQRKRRAPAKRRPPATERDDKGPKRRSSGAELTW